MFNASVIVLFSLVPQAIEIEAPTDPVPLGGMVELKIQTDDTLPNIAVQAIGRKNFNPVKVYQTVTPHLWVFTGPEDEYLITVTAAGPEGIAQESIKCLIGPRPPPVDPVDPEPEDPEGPKTTLMAIPGLNPNPQAEAAATQLRQEGEIVDLFYEAGAATVPAYLRTPMEAAEEVGFPALVVMKGSTAALKSPLPETKDEIIAAVKGVPK